MDVDIWAVVLGYGVWERIGTVLLVAKRREMVAVTGQHRFY